MQPFIESEMTFGPYVDGHCFRVEQSATYQQIQDGVQMAEFLLLRMQADTPPFIWIVEAKKSSPRPNTQPNFNEFIGEIRDKLTNALSVGVASILNRHPAAAADLPDVFKNLDLATAQKAVIQNAVIADAEFEGAMAAIGQRSKGFLDDRAFDASG